MGGDFFCARWLQCKKFCICGDSQHKSIVMKNPNVELSAIDRLPLVMPVERREDPPLDVISSYRTRLEAIQASIRWSKVVGQSRALCDSEVSDTLGVDTAQWSRIMNGKGHFPTELYQEFMGVVGNTILLRYDAYRAGQEIKPLQTELEKRLLMQQAENEELRSKLAHFEEFMRMGT